MAYLKVTNGSADTYPYTVGKLRRDNPNTSFPKIVSNDMLKDWGVFPVAVAKQPDYVERTHTCAKAAKPTLVNNVWTIDWVVTSKTAEQITDYDTSKTGENRYNRNELLKDTDWWATSDRTMSDAQKKYRQDLRDITLHSNWPNIKDTDWPTKPAAS
jgi:hypothetical protein